MKDSQRYNKLRGLIDSAKTLLGGIRINYNTQVGPNISELLEVSKQIVPLIEVEHPSIAETLENAISKISYIQPNVFTPGRGFVNAFSYGDMRTTIKFIDYLYPVQIEKKKNVRFLSVILHKTKT